MFTQFYVAGTRRIFLFHFLLLPPPCYVAPTTGGSEFNWAERREPMGWGWARRAARIVKLDTEIDPFSLHDGVSAGLAASWLIYDRLKRPGFHL